MKSICSLLLLLIIIFFSNCNKSANRPNPINCDNLITDTLGTNDTARVFAMTAFSPNRDFMNDKYGIYTRAITSIQVDVYDENNAVVFTTSQLSPADSWGQSYTATWSPVVSVNSYAKYYYRIEATTFSNHKIGMCGNLYATNCFPPNADMRLYLYLNQLTRNGFDPAIHSGESANNVCP